MKALKMIRSGLITLLIMAVIIMTMPPAALAQLNATDDPVVDDDELITIEVTMDVERIDDSTLKMTALSNGAAEVEYQFDMRVMDSGEEYTTLREYCFEPVFYWEEAVEGEIYELVVHADAGDVEYSAYYAVFGNTDPSEVVPLEGLRMEVSSVGNNVRISAVPRGGTNVIYALQYREAGGQYNPLDPSNPYQAAPTFIRTKDYGQYEFVVHAIDMASGVMEYHGYYKPYAVSTPREDIVSIEASTSQAVVGDTVTFTVTSPGVHPEYKLMKNPPGTEWPHDYTYHDWTENNSFQFTVSEPGTYTFAAWYREKGSTEASSAWNWIEIESRSGYSFLNPTVEGLRFYESDAENSTPYGQRDYSTTFDKSSTRNIFYELILSHPEPGRPVDFDIMVTYLDPGGNELKEFTHQCFAGALWSKSIHSKGSGWDQPGNWPPGTYSVQIFDNGKKLTSREFTVIDSQGEGEEEPEGPEITTGRAASFEVVLEQKRVIHMTDLFYPHSDFDDVIDLMSMFALHGAGEIDLRAVILDQPDEQAARPGNITVERLNALTGQNIPSGVGYNTFLNALRDSPGPVVVTTVGSLTDLWEAYIINPQLCREKIEAVWIFAGDARENPERGHRDGKEYHPRGLEYNVAINPAAFTGIMNSDLPIVWVPCYDGGLVNNYSDGINKVHGSYHLMQYGKLFSRSDQKVIDFFIEALSAERPEGGLYDWEVIKTHHKSLFGAGIFRAIAWPGLDYPFRFVEVNVTANDDGTVNTGEGKRIKLFERTEGVNFYSRMSKLTSTLFSYIK